MIFPLVQGLALEQLEFIAYRYSKDSFDLVVKHDHN